MKTVILSILVVTALAVSGSFAGTIPGDNDVRGSAAVKKDPEQTAAERKASVRGQGISAQDKDLKREEARRWISSDINNTTLLESMDRWDMPH